MNQSIPDSRKRLKLWKKLLFAAVPTVILFVGLEAALWLAGLRPINETRDPYVGFSEASPLMRVAADRSGEGQVETAEAKLVWFNPQQFSARKPPGTVRVFCVGGSTTYGRPFWDATSYAASLRELLPLVDPSKRYEVINAGGISYASYRVAKVMEELSAYEPDLFIVFSAHNEFLERRTYQAMFERSSIRQDVTEVLSRTRTWALLDRVIHPEQGAASRPTDTRDLLAPEVDEMLNHSIGPTDYVRDDGWRLAVLRHYEDNLRRMATIARRGGAEVVFITPAANEKDCSPFKPVEALLPADVLQRKRQLVADAERFAARQAYADAIDSLVHALEFDPRDAAVLYRVGQLQFATGRFGDAKRSFVAAIDEDVCPLRAVTEIARTIRRVSESVDAPCVDFARRLRHLCWRQQGHGCFGDEYFLDHVHPTREMHHQLAIWITDTLQRSGWIGGPSVLAPELDGRVAAVGQTIADRVTDNDRGIAFRNLAKVFHWSGKFSEAAARAQQALEILPDDEESRYILADSTANLGDAEEAIRQFQQLHATQARFPQSYLAYAELLLQERGPEAAEPYLILAAVADPSNSRTHVLLGEVGIRLGNLTMAIESLEKANELSPDDTRTLLLLAECFTSSGRFDEARNCYLQILNQQPDPETFHRLGLLYLRIGEPQHAEAQFRQALRQDPNYGPAKEALRVSGSLQ